MGKNKLGLGICFESTFPYIYKQFSENGAGVLAVLTNDAWFLNSAGAEQHLMAGVFRAIENQKWLIQCANTGLSAVITPRGKISRMLSLNKVGYIRET